jgi:predicted pyridoxine 5'-phosphate oxidase superfamily flavin-nucleotide-binding protein
MRGFAKIAFTPSVKAVQRRMGSRNAYARLERDTSEPDALGEDEIAFIRARDSFYMASVSETGWPYIQHRGGPKGFVRVIDARTIAFADLRGNRQYVSVGNVEHDDRVALIFVDYPNRARLKLLARAKIVDASEANAERVFVLTIEGVDWNCSQHITPRYTIDEMG